MWSVITWFTYINTFEEVDVLFIYDAVSLMHKQNSV